MEPSLTLPSTLLKFVVKKMMGTVIILSFSWNLLTFVIIHSTDHISDSYHIYRIKREVGKALDAHNNTAITQEERKDLIRHHLHYAHQHNDDLRVRVRRSQVSIDSLRPELL